MKERTRFVFASGISVFCFSRFDLWRDISMENVLFRFVYHSRHNFFVSCAPFVRYDRSSADGRAGFAGSASLLPLHESNDIFCARGNTDEEKMDENLKHDSKMETLILGMGWHGRRRQSEVGGRISSHKICSHVNGKCGAMRPSRVAS